MSRALDKIDGLNEHLDIIGGARHWLEDAGIEVKGETEVLCQDYQRLLRIVHILLLTEKLDRESLLDAAEAERYLA